MAEQKAVYKLLGIFSLLLIVAAFAFWICWGIAFSGWNMFDKNYIGVYSIFSVMFLFGVLGFLLSRSLGKTEATN